MMGSETCYFMYTGWPVNNRTAILSNFDPKYQSYSKVSIISIFTYISRFLGLSLKFPYLNSNWSYRWKTAYWKKSKSPHLIFRLLSTSYSQFLFYYNKILWKASYICISYHIQIWQKYRKDKKVLWNLVEKLGICIFRIGGLLNKGTLLVFMK